MKITDPEKLKYKWIVLLASFFVRFTIFGSLFAVGVLYVAWLGEFHESRGNTAWIGSLATGSCLLSAPLGSALISQIGCRRTTIAGGAVMAIGMILSIAAPNIYYLYFTYGIIAGIGAGISNLGAVVRLAEYFKKQRAFAMGIGSSGVGLGAFVFAVFQQYLMERYDWRGSMLIVGGTCLHVCAAGFLMIHPKQMIKISTSGDTDDQVQEDEEREQIESLKPRRTVKSNERKRSIFQRFRYQLRFKDVTKSLWKDPVFILLFLSDFLSWIVQFVPYMHLPNRAQALGISASDSAFLVSVMGFSGAVGKIVFGAVCTFLHLDPFKVFIVAQTFFGLSTMLSPLCVTFSSLLIYAMSFGFLSGSYALMMVIPADLLGSERFSASYGFLLAGEGIGVYLGPPIVGWISDWTNSYDSSFICAGSVLLCSAFILLLKPIAVKFRPKT